MNAINRQSSTITLHDLKEWQALENHAVDFLQKGHPSFTAAWTTHRINAAGLIFDCSSHRLTRTALDLLHALLERIELKNHIQNYFLPTSHENNDHAVHLKLRNPNHVQYQQNVQQIEKIVSALEQGTWCGFANAAMTDVVNLGIGGSEFGPRLVNQAFMPNTKRKIRCHYVSNLDPLHANQVLSALNPATTLFLVVSNSFNTTETLMNANAALAWLEQHGCARSLALAHHFVAVTAQVGAAQTWGIPEKHILQLPNGLVGRFSLWSAVGLSIAIAQGMALFIELLNGAYAMDQHFQAAPIEQNAPIMAAILGIWYGNFLRCSTQAIIPYAYGLRSLPDFLQQLHMESLGKSVTRCGRSITYQTGSIIWGGMATNSQHAFHQLLLQGNVRTPIDFILPLQTQGSHEQQKAVIANCLGQRQTLFRGYEPSDEEQLANHKRIPGGQPSNLIVMPKFTPANLGALLALYEHKVVAQAMIWQINPFDQWGVERGKILAQSLLQDLHANANNPRPEYDQATLEWLNECQALQIESNREEQ